MKSQMNADDREIDSNETLAGVLEER